LADHNNKFLQCSTCVCAENYRDHKYH